MTTGLGLYLVLLSRKYYYEYYDVSLRTATLPPCHPATIIKQQQTVASWFSTCETVIDLSWRRGEESGLYFISILCELLSLTASQDMNFLWWVEQQSRQQRAPPVTARLSLVNRPDWGHRDLLCRGQIFLTKHHPVFLHSELSFPSFGIISLLLSHNWQGRIYFFIKSSQNI